MIKLVCSKLGSEVICMTRSNKNYLGNTNALKYKTQEELKKGIDAYFKDCEKRKAPYTMSGLALALGIDRKTLINYAERDLFYALVKEAKDKVQKQLEENALANKSNATFTIFNLKNNYGWTDESKVETKIESNGILDDLVGALKDVKKD